MKQLFPSAVSPHEANRSFMLPGLDGLRAIAVLLVIVYHLWPTSVPGGMIGVDIFFVISGYLITALLLREGSVTGRISLLLFWKRRARRLLPAIALLILVTGPIALAIGGDIQVNLGRQLTGAGTFSSNWLSIFSGNDYFAQTSPELFTNFWSLAVEEQFYLFWPLLLVAAGVILGRRWRRFSLIIFIAIIASLTSGTVMLAFGAPISRIYYGTDTHVYGLLLGVLLAFSIPWSLYPPRDKHVIYRVAQPFGAVTFLRVILSWLCLVALIPLALLMPEKAPGTIPWGLLGASLLTLGVIQGILPDMLAGASSLLRSVLSFGPLTWIGQRSYGLYLWHWPLAVMAHYLLGVDRSPLWNVVVLLVTVIIAELSYRYLETPVRRYGFRSSFAQFFGSIRYGRYRALPIIALVLVMGAGSATAVAVRTAPDQTSAQRAVEEGKKRAQERLKAREEQRAHASASPTASSTAANPSAATSAVPDEYPQVNSADVTVIGDSVVLSAEPDIYDAMPDATIDAAEGRTIVQALPMVKSWSSQGKIGNVLVLSVTANSTLMPGQLEEVLRALPADTKLVLATGYGPRTLTWIDSSNNLIREFAQKNSSRVYIADWNGAITQAVRSDPSLMTSDGVHPEVKGQMLYARILTEAVARAQS